MTATKPVKSAAVRAMERAEEEERRRTASMSVTVTDNSKATAIGGWSGVGT